MTSVTEAVPDDATDASTLVACCQVAPVLGDLPRNRAVLDGAVREAAGRGAQVVVLPELASSGYAFVDRAHALACAEPADGPTVRGWAALALELGIVIVGGFCERDDEGQVRNSAALVDPSGVRAIYRKVHLWDRERLIFTAGDEPPPVVRTDVGVLSMMICYDLEFPEWVRLPALAGAQLLCAPTNWPRATWPAGERPGEITRAMVDAAVNRMYLAVCDRVGDEGGLTWIGGSAVIDPDGWPLAGGRESEAPALLLAACRLGRADDKGLGGLSDALADRRPDLYRRHLD